MVEKKKEGNNYAGRQGEPPPTLFKEKEPRTLGVGYHKILQHRRKKTMSEINEDLQGCRLDLKSSLML